MGFNRLLFLVQALAITAVPAMAQGSDDCSAAMPIAGPGPHAVDTTGAIYQSSQSQGCAILSKDVWFEWVAPADGLYSVDQCSSTHVRWSVAVWDGCGGNVLACKYFYNCTAVDNKVIFRATAGVGYRIQVASGTSEVGSFTVDPFFPNPHDDCHEAEPVSGFGAFPFDRSYATGGSAGAMQCYSVWNDVWMVWTAPYDGLVKLDADVRVRVHFYGDGCGGDETLCKAITPGYSHFFEAEAHRSYLLRLGWHNNEAALQGSLTFAPKEPEVFAGNGHAYLEIPTRVTWREAKLAAESMRYRGGYGHLVTVSHLAEGTHVGGMVTFTGAWLGLYQDTADANFSEPAGGWKWTTGEPLNYTQWKPPSQPDNLFGEDAAEIHSTGDWNDQILTRTNRFVVEWDLNLQGDSFCDHAPRNSTGLSSYLSAVPSAVASSGIRLEASNGPAGQFGYFLVGSGTQSPGLAIGDGLLCLGTAASDLLGRYNVYGTSFNSIGMFDGGGALQNLAGTSSVGYGFEVPLALPFAGAPTIQSGETWHFQLWHREPGGTSNFSSGISLGF